MKKNLINIINILKNKNVKHDPNSAPSKQSSTDSNFRVSRFSATTTIIIILLLLTTTLAYFSFSINKDLSAEKSNYLLINSQKNFVSEELIQIKQELDNIKNEDQFQKNEKLNQEVENINKTYLNAVAAYEDILKLKENNVKTQDIDTIFSASLALLAKRDYEKANEKISQLNNEIKKEEQKIADSFKIPESLPVSSSPPASGYSRQKVATDIGEFMVSIISGELSNTKVIVDTASGGDCKDNCPTLPLADYISRNGAYAGINGSYFCPADYPSCAGKTNTFDTLLMNKDKVYFNSDNNVYSNNPAVIFGGSYVRFVTAASQWGRDTGIDSMISNYPLLVNNSNIAFGGDDDPKKGSKSGRSFFANKGNSVYIGVVHNATVGESAKVLQVMGMENALNLDSGGSTALWAGGYKVGPGRGLPNAILFIRK